MSFKINSLYLTDGYKVGHKRMLAPGTDFLYGTWIPRSTKHAPEGIDKTVSFGQQLAWKWLHDEYQENFFEAPLSEAIAFSKDMSLYLGADFDGNHFEELHKLGYLPVKVKSLPEGIETDANIPHMTFVNTVKGYAWLTLYLETIVSSLAWKSSTSATLALKYRRNVEECVMKTDASNSGLIPFLCHDFSARGLSPWDMITSGLGHATSFLGSDTLPVIPAARYFYNEPKTETAIYSVNASEHSVSTTKIFTVGEKQMLVDWLKEFPTGILSVVADTFDLWKLITEYLTDPEVKELVMSRDGKLVIRPDSGDPVDIICGTLSKLQSLSKEQCESEEVFLKWAEDYMHDRLCDETPHGEYGGDLTCDVVYDHKIYNLTYSPDWNRFDKQFYHIDNYGDKTPEINSTREISSVDKGVVELLWDIFGGTVNDQGYKVLDSHIGAIYGDSINLDRQIKIYKRLEEKGFACTNVVLGIGSFTYQMNTRDTLGFAAKGAWFECNGKGYEIYKDPITDDGTKKSLKGLIQVFEENGEHGNFKVKTQCSKEEENSGILQTIYEDGNFYNQTTLSEVRSRINLLVKTEKI